MLIVCPECGTDVPVVNTVPKVRSIEYHGDCPVDGDVMVLDF